MNRCVIAWPSQNAAAKGRFIQNATMSSTVSPGLRLDLGEFTALGSAA